MISPIISCLGLNTVCFEWFLIFTQALGVMGFIPKPQFTLASMGAQAHCTPHFRSVQDCCALGWNPANKKHVMPRGTVISCVRITGIFYYCFLTPKRNGAFR